MIEITNNDQVSLYARLEMYKTAIKEKSEEKPENEQSAAEK